MPNTTRHLIEQHWELSNQRDWSAFAKLLAPGLRYEVPQTREYIETGAGYLDMFCTWPGDWQVQIKQLVCEGSRAISIIDFHVDGQVMTGISSFEVQNGLITAVTDYWPEPYEPPARLSAHMKRRPV